jgi:5-methylcytosine-specific restriction endonuclease McrA
MKKELKWYVDFRVDNEIIKKYEEEYKNMSKVRKRNKVIKEWMNKNNNQIKEFEMNYKYYFENKILNRKEFKESFYYKDSDKAKRKCFYCGITEKEIEKLADNNQIRTKRYYSRGKTMEIDRLKPNKAYTINNIVLSCYWCNNAKSDEYSVNEFVTIGRGIRKIWKERLKELGKE